MGAEILVVIHGPDKGLPVVVKDTPAIWGRLEDKRVWVGEGKAPGDFWGGYAIVEISDMTAAQVHPFLEHWIEPWVVDPLFFVRRHRRKWRLVWADIPAGAKTNILNGFISVTKAQIKPYFRNRKTNEEIA